MLLTIYQWYRWVIYVSYFFLSLSSYFLFKIFSQQNCIFLFIIYLFYTYIHTYILYIPIFYVYVCTYVVRRKNPEAKNRDSLIFGARARDFGISKNNNNILIYISMLAPKKNTIYIYIYFVVISHACGHTDCDWRYWRFIVLWQRFESHTIKATTKKIREIATMRDAICANKKDFINFPCVN